MRIGHLLLASGVVASTACASQPIVIDGYFDDWASIDPIVIDTIGDANPDTPDLLSLSVAKDSERLYMLLELDRETLQQEAPAGATGIGNSIKLHIDGDGDPATGMNDGFGSEIQVEFGSRTLTLWSDGEAISPTFAQADFASVPTHSSTKFEFSTPFTSTLEGETISLITSDSPRIFLTSENSGDRLPDEGAAVAGSSSQFNNKISPVGLSKDSETDIRLLSFNVLRDKPATEPEPFVRILQATQPDIIAFQELYDMTAEEALTFVADALPLPEGESWVSAKNVDNITVSRFPILENANVGGNLVSYIDLPDDRSPHELVLFNAHTPCCANNDGRDAEHDEISFTWKTLLEGTGPFPINPDDAMITTGDFNMVGFVRQRETIQDGVFINSAAYGPNFSPNRALGSLGTVSYRHTHTPVAFTWFSSGSSFYPGVLDWTFYTSDVMTLRNRYGLFTPTIPQDVLDEAGLLPDDSLASDHLPLIADFDLLKGVKPKGLLVF